LTVLYGLAGRTWLFGGDAENNKETAPGRGRARQGAESILDQPWKSHNIGRKEADGNQILLWFQTQGQKTEMALGAHIRREGWDMWVKEGGVREKAGMRGSRSMQRYASRQMDWREDLLGMGMKTAGEKAWKVF